MSYIHKQREISRTEVNAEVGSVGIEAPGRSLGGGVRVGGGAEEADGDAAPQAAGAVDGEGVERVVNLKEEEEEYINLYISFIHIYIYINIYIWTAKTSSGSSI